MKTKKIVSALSVVTLATAMMAGCNSGGETSTTAATTANTETTAATTLANSETTAATGATKTKFPIVDKPVKYRIVATTEPNQAEFGDMEFFKQLEEKTNVQVEWECYQSLNYGDQKNLMLASGNLPDAFFGYGSFTMDDVNKNAPLGMVIPLDDLIDQYAPVYKERLTENDLLNGLSKAHDGKRYSFGTVIESDTRNYPDNLYINKAWLDKLGLQIPTTIDEYYDVLKAFKEKDPNGNGKADEIPFTFTKYNHITGYGSFFGAYGRVDVHNGSAVKPDDHIVVEDDKVVFTADKQEYKDAIVGLGKFFKDNLFDKEGLVQEQNQYQAKMKSPEAIVGSFYAWATAGSVDPANAEQYVAIKPLKGPSGEEPHVKQRRNHINVMGSGFAITNQAKNPEILVKWIDAFYEPQQSIEAQYGPIGMAITDNGDGTYEYIKTPGPNGEGYMEMWSTWAPQDGAPKFISSEMFGTVIPYNEGDTQKMEVINKYYKTLPNDLSLPNMNYTEEEIKLNTSLGLDISNLVKEKQSQWLLGTGDVNAEWDAYVAQLEKLGLSRFLESMQKAYDRTIGK